jgi:predicted transcriptional regulator
MPKIIRQLFLYLNLGISFSVYPQDNISINNDTLTAKPILRGETQETREQWRRRQLFVENILTQGAVNTRDSTLLFRIQHQSPLRLSKSQLEAIAPRVDQIEEKFRREQLGLPPMSPIGTLIGKGVKYLAEKLGGAGAAKNPLAVIPSEHEIEVMNVLWEKNAATSVEIYANLDSVKLTAADLQHTLADMTDRGLLDRQQISPRHELTILGVFTIEESALNRKNREYLYRPKVARQTMLSFLDATAFSNRLASADNHSLILDHLRKLMTRLVMTGE